MPKIFINSENLRGRRPVTGRIAGKDPQTILIIIYIPSSTALLPDNTARATFHHDALREPVARQCRPRGKRNLTALPRLTTERLSVLCTYSAHKKPPANASG